MRNLLTAIATAALVFAVMTAAGLAVANFLMPAPANIYRMSVYDITLPRGWGCEMESSELVCTPPGPQPYHAMLIATMKYRNPQTDTFAAYETHLKMPTSPSNEPTSIVEQVKRSVINGRTWVEGTHLNSEVIGYRTHYMTTLTAQVAILITFSYYAKDLEAYQPVLEEVVRSVNIYQRSDEADGLPN
ncbi:hypothetical protein ACIP1G_02990 [Pseudomonas sp. NPDC089392]|uniref:hypothetical protein n=1 Tax=Pseudomonas sp. NPDC089392 TaxID=3364459 RepID=UPI00382E90AF